MDGFQDVLHSMLAPHGPDTPHCQQAVVKQAQALKKPWLTCLQLLSLLDLLQNNDKVVETYMVLEDDVSKDWVWGQLGMEILIPWSDSE